MAWSPVRRINAGLVWVEAPGDYATLNSNHLRDGTGREREGLTMKKISPKILYTSSEVHTWIKRLFGSPDLSKRRVIIVAYLGRDADAFLPAPRGIRIICSPSPVATSFEGIMNLKERCASIEFSGSLHSKVYSSEDRGCLFTSANLSTSALAIGGLKDFRSQAK